MRPVRFLAAVAVVIAACGGKGAGAGAAHDDAGQLAGAAAEGGKSAGGSGSASAAGRGGSGAAGSGGSGLDAGSCLQRCDGRSCGDDGCHGSCGSCGAGLVCSSAGQCVQSACKAGCTSDCEQGCFDLGRCEAKGSASLDLEPNLLTLGAVLTTSAAPQTAALFYRPEGSATWWKGPALVRIQDGRLAGSAFGLSPSTAYEVRVQAGAVVACGATTTEPNDPAHVTGKQLWVDAAASGEGDGSQAAPYRSIQAALNAAGPGVDVHVRAGVYREELHVARGGSGGAYLRLLGEAGAVLDGSDAQAERGLSWRDESGGVWSAPLSSDPRYAAHNGERLYHYLSLDALKRGLGYNDVPIAEGFFVDAGRIYVRLAAAPSGQIFQIPALNTALSISGVSHVWVEGIEIRHYGSGDYAKGVDVTQSASDIVLRKNHVHETPSPIWVRKGSSAVRVEDNELNQSSVFGWPWNAVKATDHENSAVTLAGGRGAIVSGNSIHDIFNGVYAGSFDDDKNPVLAFDVDVYDNRLTRIGDDGFEPEGACINHRIWRNSVDLVHNGVSLAPITFGPVWVLKNRFTAYRESGFKLSNDTSGPAFLYHNTCYTDAPAHNGMNVSGAFSGLVFRNNVIRGTQYALESTIVVQGNDLDYDALFTTRGSPRLKWNDVRYDDVAALCAATQQECHGVGSDPGLADPSAGRFGPAAQSPLIDAAERLYGINDGYRGKAPDIGYVEAGDNEPAQL